MATSIQDTRTRSISETFAEGLRYFMGQGELNRALSQLGADLDSHGIDYVVIGAVAMLAYGYPRFTEDLDLIMTTDGLKKFHNELVGLGCVPAFPNANKNFSTMREGVKVEIITSGGFPGDGRPKPISFPDPSDGSAIIDGIRFVTIEKLVELKLASGMTASDRLKDLGDVQELIKFRGLDAEFAERLNPYVRDQFLTLLAGVENAPPTENEGTA